MRNYAFSSYVIDGGFKKDDIVTDIPKDLVENIKETLSSAPNYEIVGPMLDENQKDILFAIIEDNTLKYKIFIKSVQQ